MKHSACPSAARTFPFLWAALWLVSGPALPNAQAEVDYARSLKPLLKERCFSCHGALKQKGGLRLDTVELMRKGGESGPAIVPGQPEKSVLWERVTSKDETEFMPPKHEGEPLNADQMRLLKDWIATGAPAPANEKPEADPRDHWAFRPRVRPPVPSARNAAWVRNPIDAFLAQAHEKAGLTPQPEAPRSALIRRLFLDLIGLPPTPEEFAAIEADTSAAWYETLVDQLLADPRHGERWARHWMDIWRYSEWWGLGNEWRNSAKHMWHFRDWIVESLNADTGYDEMVRLMLAADELHPEDPAKLRATGFLARNFNVYSRLVWLDETVEHVGKGLLGLTLNCSKCHAHKYDPISQEDYYQMRAFFEPYHVRLDVVPGESDLEKDGLPRVFDGQPDTPTYLLIRGNEATPDKSKPIQPGVPSLLAFDELKLTPVSFSKAVYEPQRRPWVVDAHLNTARRSLSAAEAAAAKEPTPQNKHTVALAKAELESIERRAAAMQAAWAAEDAPSAGEADPLRIRSKELAIAAAKAERQLALLKAWGSISVVTQKLAKAAEARKDPAGIVALEKELSAARTAVEKATKEASEPSESFAPLTGGQWAQTMFDRAKKDPLVPFQKTSTGRRRALADWIVDPRNPLTARVAVNHLWMRHMGRPLVSTVFDFGRKGNTPAHPELLDWLASELIEGQPGNHSWSMKHLHRLIVTSSAYRMTSSSAGAEAAKQADPDNLLLWRRDSIRLDAEVIRDSLLSIAGKLDPSKGGPTVPVALRDFSNRRSLYLHHSGVDRSTFLSTFDAADAVACYQRDQSIVPQQALALSNAAFAQDAAATVSAQITREIPITADEEAFLVKAFLRVLGRLPDAFERANCRKTMDQLRALPELKDSSKAAELAREQIVAALLNHNDFVTLR